jgi:hypothetical protein
VGRAGRDRTLNDGIRVLSGGMSSWPGRHQPSPIRYARSRVDVAELADHLVGFLQRLPGDVVDSGLTSGSLLSRSAFERLVRSPARARRQRLVWDAPTLFAFDGRLPHGITKGMSG